MNVCPSRTGTLIRWLNEGQPQNDSCALGTANWSRARGLQREWTGPQGCLRERRALRCVAEEFFSDQTKRRSSETLRETRTSCENTMLTVRCGITLNNRWSGWEKNPLGCDARNTFPFVGLYRLGVRAPFPELTPTFAGS